VFSNLDWILQNGPRDATWDAEFGYFDSLYQTLKKLEGWSPMPAFVAAPYLALKQKLEHRSSQSS
jgi:hypothetical protein